MGSKKLFVIGAWICLIISASLLYQERGAVYELINKTLSLNSAIPKIVSELPLKEIAKQVITSTPLRAKVESPRASLTINGTIAETNNERVINGFRILNENALLDAAAMAKANDILEKQYFEHISPDGRGPADLANSVGYEYILIGENLALGNFEDDKALVTAWMDSPGHRANILKSRYMEIGVAVKKGIYEGRSTWVAVQEFGLPLSSCPATDKSLKITIEANNIQLNVWEEELRAKKEDLENTRPKHGPAYNEKVDEYNELVGRYNDLVAITKALVNDYNNQVNELNKCIAS